MGKQLTKYYSLDPFPNIVTAPQVEHLCLQDPGESDLRHYQVDLMPVPISCICVEDHTYICHCQYHFFLSG